MDTLTILGICGSLRKDSYNKKLLSFAQKTIGKDAVIETVEIGNLPFFSQEVEGNPPDVVVTFREKIKAADALFFVTPEYNYSLPGVVKNAIEWGSRPYATAVLHKKPVAIMGASNGMLGTGRAQYHFRQMCVQTDMLILNRPEAMIPFVQEKFDAQGNLVDQKTKDKVKELLDALIDWTKKLKSAGLEL